MESDSDESESHTVTTEDEKDYEQMGIDSLLQECVPLQILAPKFAGSNPPEAVGFFRAKKSPARLPLEGK
jgi:hypothetical protein